MYCRKAVISIKGLDSSRIPDSSYELGAVHFFVALGKPHPTFLLLNAKFLFLSAIEDICCLTYKIDTEETSAGQPAAESSTVLVAPCRKPQTLPSGAHTEIC